MIPTCPLCNKLPILEDGIIPILEDGILIGASGTGYSKAECCNHSPLESKAYEQGFWCFLNHNTMELTSYCLNVKIDNVMYGFDSQTSPPKTDVFIIDLLEIIPLLSSPNYTEFPNDPQYFENTIRRILNLKAFL
jgi:hypothetical protein